MLFRRIKAHVEKENWFAVGVDFFIVVVGVFIGLQVQQWAVERNRATSETAYLERLHGEVVHVTETRMPLVEERQNNLSHLGSANLVLAGRLERQDLSDDECEAISEAWIYSNVTADLPTTIELLSAGKLDSISAADIRSAIISLDQTVRRARDVAQALSVNVVTLNQAHPNLITLEMESDGIVLSESDMRESCDTAEMRANSVFLNNFADNIWRYENYYAVSVDAVSESLETLHSLLDRELEINHAETGRAR